MEKKRKLQITPREKKLINRIAQGDTDAEIAKTLDLSVSRIGGIISELFLKTQTLNRAHLVYWAFRNNLLR